MKRLFYPFLGLVFALSASISVQAQKLPMPSPDSEVEQTVGLTEVEITYSRPSMKGRTVFGSLVPYGEIWRTGANKCTTIELEDAVKIGGMDIDSGTYSLFTIPGKDEWTIIINKNTELWGAGNYKQEEDVMRFTAKPMKLADAVETFTIGFSNVSQGSADITLSWENTAVSFPVTHDYMEQAQANIKEALAGEDIKFGAYESAAEFYLDNNLDAKQALAWARQSVEMKEVFWNVYTLSLALKANDMNEQAIKAAERSLELAKEADYQAYIDRNQKNIEAWSK